MDSLISIIVPCFNVDLYLKDCVDSILCQTYAHWELILVDDGSPGETPFLCDQFAATDKRIKVIHKSNGGLVSARNAGYKAAKGQWIMYVDGDDWIAPETCEVLIEKAIEHDPDVIFWNSQNVLNGKVIKGKYRWNCTGNEKVYLHEECKDLARNTLIYTSGIATAYSKLLRKDFIEQNQLWHNPKLRQGAEGLEFSLRVFDAAKKAMFINKTFYNYRYNENSISKTVDEKNTGYLVDCFKEIDLYIQRNNTREYFLSAFHQRVMYVLIAIAMSTYFHPSNKDRLPVKIRKYKEVIYNNNIFKDALANGSVSELDKFRKITIYLIKHKFYFLLPVISGAKQYLLGKGIFNY